ncbi:MAG TPA: M23 family metallopeptidase [Rhodothermales bacterium]|nr:M23 family metallopeptidase [Rhodothermales bacterium]
MKLFLLDLWRNPAKDISVITMDVNGLETPQQYLLAPRPFMTKVLAGIGGVFLLVVMIFLIFPIREWVIGGVTGGGDPIRTNADRLAALQDSLETQQLYLLKLREILLGADSAKVKIRATIVKSDTTATHAKVTDVGHSGDTALSNIAPQTKELSAASKSSELRALVKEISDSRPMPHQQPALALSIMSVPNGHVPPIRLFLNPITLPALPPVGGFVTRGFEAKSGHYGIDIAVQKGTAVRSIADGYVTFADWTHEGGFVIVIQHAGGYISVYKHNGRLLKRVGERVRSREAIAMSGNTGEISSGPHLHFELWHEGLAQDPRTAIIGW